MKIINIRYKFCFLLGPTYFAQVPSPKKITIEANESIELHCEASSDPRLTVEYHWTINGQMINKTKPIEVKQGISSLMLNNLRGNDSGLIDCVAVTDVDVKVAGVKLLVRGIISFFCNTVIAIFLPLSQNSSPFLELV